MVNDFSAVMAVILASLAAMVFVAIIIALVLYIYCAIALMTIAKKTKTKNAWLAWIPLANVYLVTQIAKLQWQYVLLALLMFIPKIGGLVCMGLTVWWFWRIAEVRKMPGWIGILMLIPVVNLVVLGILAWGK